MTMRRPKGGAGAGVICKRCGGAGLFVLVDYDRHGDAELIARECGWCGGVGAESREAEGDDDDRSGVARE